MKIRIKNQRFIDITNHAARCLFIHHNFCNECAGNHGDKKTGCYAESNNRYDIISFYMICVANVHLYH